MNVPGFVFNPDRARHRGRGHRLPDRRAGRTGGGAVHPPLDHRGRRGGLHDRHRRGAGRCGVRRRGGLRPLLRRAVRRPSAKPGCSASAASCWSIMGWTTMRHRPRTVGDPVADDREHRVATHFHYASSSFFITVFNPLTVMAFGAAFAGPQPGRRRRQPARRRPSGGRACSAARSAWWTILCAAAVALRARFTGTGMLWLNRSPAR